MYHWGEGTSRGLRACRASRPGHQPDVDFQGALARTPDRKTTLRSPHSHSCPRAAKMRALCPPATPPLIPAARARLRQVLYVLGPLRDGERSCSRPRVASFTLGAQHRAPTHAPTCSHMCHAACGGAEPREGGPTAREPGVHLTCSRDPSTALRLSTPKVEIPR